MSWAGNTIFPVTRTLLPTEGVITLILEVSYTYYPPLDSTATVPGSEAELQIHSIQLIGQAPSPFLLTPEETRALISAIHTYEGVTT